MNNIDFKSTIGSQIVVYANRLFDDYVMNGDRYKSFGDYLRSSGFTLREIKKIVDIVRENK